MDSSRFRGRQARCQRGATIVELAIVVLLFLTLVFAIIEFTLAMFKYASVAEGVRAGVRWAIVNNPICDVFDSSPDCADGFLWKDTNPGGGCECSGGCSAAGGAGIEEQCAATACDDLLQQMNAVGGVYGSVIVASNVKVSYVCTDAGFDKVKTPIPSVTVEVTDVPYNFFVPGLFGIPAQVNLPAFSLTRLGEDMATE